MRTLLLLLLALPAVAADDVGVVRFANSGAPAAQEPFARGLALLHNFEYETAAIAFREAQKADPDFAMAYWGEAMTYTHPIWFQQDREAALAVLQRLGKTPAERMAKAKTERERDYLRALDVLYGDGEKNARDFLYAEAMDGVRQRYPEDVDATAFYAVALLGTAHEGRDFATYMRAAALLEEVFPKNQRHPGVLHYLIHSYDDPVHAPLGMRAARIYGSVAPNAGHALHMTSHIFIAMGMWDDVIDANRRAIDVVNLERKEKNRPPADCGHYPIWLHYGLLQKGQVEEANKALDACRDSAFTMPFVSGGPMDSPRQRFDSYAEMRAHHIATGHPLQKVDLEMKVPASMPGPSFTMVYGDVLRGRPGALEELRTLHKEVVAMVGMDSNPTRRIRADVMLQEAEALALLAAGKRAEAIAILEAAAKAEQAMPLEFGPPVVPKPAAELLAEQLLAASRNADAAGAYELVLARTPGRTIAVQGAARAGEAVRKQTKPAEVHIH